MMPKPAMAVKPIEKRAMPAATDGSITDTPSRMPRPISQPMVRWP